jgi:hypothetical protein
MFPHINALGILFVSQVIGLIGVASMLGVDTVVIVLERLYAQIRLPGSKSNGS